MAHNPDRPDVNENPDRNVVAEDDPFAALANLMDDLTPKDEAPEAPVETVEPADDPAAFSPEPHIEPEPHIDVAPAAGEEDLEAQLMSELGFGVPQEAAPEAVEPVAQEPVFVEPERHEATVEPVYAAEAPEVQSNLEDDLEALLGDDLVAPAEEEGFAPEADTVEPDYPAYVEAEPQGEAVYDEPVAETSIEDDLDALFADEFPSERAVADLEPTVEPLASDDALVADFDAALEQEFNDVNHDANASRLEPDWSVDEAETPVEQNYNAGAYAAAGAAGAAALGAGLAHAAQDDQADLHDDVFSHIEPQNPSALDELEAILGAEDEPVIPPAHGADMPLVDTHDLASSGPSVADFAVPDMPDTGPAEMRLDDPFAIDDQDLEIELGQAMTGADASEDALDSLFDDAAFEAEFAKDMEFADHDRSHDGALEDDIFSDDYVAPDAAEEEKPKNRRGFFVAAAIAALAGLGAVGVLTMSGGSDTTTGPVTVEADPAPIRVEPDEPGGTQVPNQDRAVFGEAGTDAGSTQQELVTTSEEPVDITSSSAVSATNNAAASDERLTATADTQTSNNAATSVNPRRVRTLVVRPDGTLVEQPIEEAQPVQQAQTPANAVTSAQTDVVSATDNAVNQAADAAQGVAADAARATNEAAQAVTSVTETAQTATTEAVEQTAAQVQTGAEQVAATTQQATEQVAAATQDAAATTREAAPRVPVRTVSTQTINPPIIAERPADQPVNIVNQQTEQATTTTTAQQPATEQVAANASPFVVQIASVPSRQGAQEQATALQQRFSSVLAGRGISIQEAQIPNRGTFYRVRVGATSRADANELCARYQRAGGSCFVSR